MKKNGRINFSGILSTFFIVVICLNVVATIYLIDSTKKLNQELVSIKSTIINTTESNTNDELIAIYKDIDEKTSISIDRIITIVAIFAGMVTLFGVVLAFRAPHDLEKSIETVKGLAEEAQEAAIDAKYFSEIIEAMIIDFNGSPTLRDKINNLDGVIDKYSNNADAYRYRGVYYGLFAHQTTDYDKKKEYHELALSDFKSAIRLGNNKSKLLDYIGNLYSNQGDYSRAIKNYNKALKIDEKNYSAYYNRANANLCLFDDENNIEIKRELLKKSVDDCTKSIEINGTFYYAYGKRGYTYWRQAMIEQIFNRKIDLLHNSLDDLAKALEINPDFQLAKENLEMSLYKQLCKCQ
jgi:tetratricopeptide (TPR) repeat protein